MSPVIELAEVRKTYRSGDIEFEALRGIDLAIEEGEFVAIMGPSGSGKSTLMHILGCLDDLSSGSYRLAGHDVSELDELELARIRNREIGFVFQGFNLIPTLSAQENVETALAPLGVSSADRRRRAAEALASVGLADRGNHLPSELSGGQQQRVAIARALVKDPEVLLADEPTGNLDEETRDEIMDLLEGLWRDRGLTLVIVTHDSAVARRAQRRLHIKQGKVKEVA